MVWKDKERLTKIDQDQRDRPNKGEFLISSFVFYQMLLSIEPLFLEIYRFKVGNSYEKFTKNYIIKTQFVYFAYFETRKFEN
jgi:hypothetical protein